MSRSSRRSRVAPGVSSTSSSRAPAGRGRRRFPRRCRYPTSIGRPWVRHRAGSPCTPPSRSCTTPSTRSCPGCSQRSRNHRNRPPREDISGWQLAVASPVTRFQRKGAKTQRRKAPTHPVAGYRFQACHGVAEGEAGLQVPPPTRVACGSNPCPSPSPSPSPFWIRHLTREQPADDADAPTRPDERDAGRLQGTEVRGGSENKRNAKQEKRIAESGTRKAECGKRKRRPSVVNSMSFRGRRVYR